MISNYQIDASSNIDNLKKFDPKDTASLAKIDIEDEMISLQEKLVKLQDVFFAAKKRSLLIVLQGMDCSGKDGTVKIILAGLNPNGFSVESFKVPNSEEIGHDYLWRIHRKTPMRGYITVFNRSYYEDVLVTRIHKTINDKTAAHRFREIKEFEKYLVNNDTIILKFFLHISKDFQESKLENRLLSPEKYWKFSEADLHERNFWQQYQSCYADVLDNCSTKEAPWYVIPSDNRWFRDYLILKIIVKTLDELDLKYPELEGNVNALIQELKAKK